MKYALPLAILIVLHVVFLLIDAYSIAQLDSLMHLIGGFLLGFFVYGVLNCMISSNWLPDPGRVIMQLLIVSLVATGAVCWEFFEWFSDAFFSTSFQLSVNDTIKDLFLGMLGGSIYVVLLKLKQDSGRHTRKSGTECKPMRTRG